MRTVAYSLTLYLHFSLRSDRDSVAQMVRTKSNNKQTSHLNMLNQSYAKTLSIPLPQIINKI